MKNYLIVLIAVGSAGIGMFLNYKLTKAPVCNCPEIKIPRQQPVLEVNSIDVSELKKLKIRGGFTYSPQFHANEIVIVQSNVDSTIKK